MSTKRKHIVDSVVVGEALPTTGAGLLSEEHTIVATFVDFAKLSHKTGSLVESPPMKCHGHDWSIHLYPGGDTNNKQMAIFVKMHRASGSDDKTTVRAKMAIRCCRTTAQLGKMFCFALDFCLLVRNCIGTKFRPFDAKPSFCPVCSQMQALNYGSVRNPIVGDHVKIFPFIKR